MMRLRREDPRSVGAYRLMRRLGAGGMGVVYLGADRRGQKVALKLIRSDLAEDTEFRSRFAREVSAASRIRGGCTVPVVAADLEAARPWLATSYVPGPALQKKVNSEGPLPVGEVAALGATLAEGLARVHEAGVVHRDLKPSNILLSPKGPRIIDFGIAWSSGASTLTHVGTAIGSPGFLAPEQVRGAPVTSATDVFAFGVTLAYAATGGSPFGSGTSEVMLYRVVHEEPDLSDVPSGISPVIEGCLAKEPEERPSTARIAAVLHEISHAENGAEAPVPSRAGEHGRGRGQNARPRIRAQRASTPVRVGEQDRSSTASPAATPSRRSTDSRGAGPSSAARTPRDRSGRSSGPTSGRSTRATRETERLRLLRQRVIIFITVTILAAVGITAAQGCEGPDDSTGAPTHQVRVESFSHPHGSA